MVLYNLFSFFTLKNRLDQVGYNTSGLYEINTIDRNILTDAFLEDKNRLKYI